MFNFKIFDTGYIIATIMPSSPQFYQMFSKVFYTHKLCGTDIFIQFYLPSLPFTPTINPKIHISNFVWHGAEWKHKGWNWEAF